MQRLAPQRRISGETALGVDVDAVLQRRRAQHAEFRGEIVREMFDDDRIAAERHVGSVLLARANRNDQSWIVGERVRDLIGTKLLQAPGLECAARALGAGRG